MHFFERSYENSENTKISAFAKKSYIPNGKELPNRFTIFLAVSHAILLIKTHSLDSYKTFVINSFSKFDAQRLQINYFLADNIRPK